MNNNNTSIVVFPFFVTRKTGLMFLILFSFFTGVKGQIPPGYSNIDFEEFSIGKHNDTIYSKGFRIYNMPYEDSLVITDVFGTSKTLMNNNWSSAIYLEAENDSVFSLAALDYFGDDPWQGSSTVDATVYGILSNNDTLKTDYSSNENVAKTLNLNWTDLKRVIIDFRTGATQNYGAIDNLVVRIGFFPKKTLTVINGSGSGDYEPGTLINIVADTPPEGKMFYQWTGDSIDNVANINLSSTTFTMPSGDAVITATYIDGTEVSDTNYVYVNSNENHIYLTGLLDSENGNSEINFTASSLDTAIISVIGVDYTSGNNIAILRIKEKGLLGETHVLVTATDGSRTIKYDFLINVRKYNNEGQIFQIHDVVFWQEVIPMNNTPVYDTIISSGQGPWDKLDPDRIPITVGDDCTGDYCTGFDFFTVFYKGYFIPTVTGTYTFFMESQDDMSFWLSNDDNYNNAEAIIYKGDNKPKVGTDIGNMQWESAPRQLQAGHPYAFYATQWIVHTKKGGILVEGPEISKQFIPGQYMMPVIDFERPTTVTNIKEEIKTSDKIKISWECSTDNIKVSGYRVYVDGKLLNNELITDLSAEITGLSEGTNYSIIVTAVDQVNNESLSSEIINISTYAKDNTPPTPPTSMQTLVTTGVSSKITWSGDTDDVAVIGYNLYIDDKLYNNTDYIYSDTMIISGLSPLTTYKVKIESVDASYNTSSKSNEFSFITSEFDPYGPSLGEKIGRLKVEMKNIATSEGIGINGPWQNGDIINNTSIKQLTEELKPGTIRWGGIPANTYSFSSSTGTGKVNTYAKMLNLANETGSMFSLVVGVNDDVDYINDISTFTRLMEYLGGPAGTPGGDIRASEGYSDPLLQDSKGVIIEFGNEVWGADAHYAPIGNNYSTYAEWCRQAANIIKSSPYYDSTKITLVYSGRNPHPDDSYGLNRTVLKGDKGEVDALAVSGYLGGNLTYDPDIPHGETELQYYKYRIAYEQHNFEGFVETMRMMYGLTGDIKPFYLYEANLTTPSYNGRLGQAVVITDYLINSIRYGSIVPSIFQLTGGEWKITTSDGTKLPFYHMAQHFNSFCKGDMLKTTFETKEKITDGAGNPISLAPVGTYAFSDSVNFSVLLISRDFENDFTVQLDLPDDFHTGNNAEIITLSGDGFSSLDTKIDTTTITMSDSILINIPKYSMVIVSFTGDNQHFKRYKLGSINEVLADSIEIIPETDSVITENQQRIYFYTRIYPSNTLITDVTWEAVKLEPDTMTYKMGISITGKFYVKGSGTCSGNGTVTVRATSKRNPSVYADYKVKISNQGIDCDPSTAIVDENTVENWFYPNPATSRLFINNPFSDEALLTIYDMAGNRVAEKPVNSKTETLNINELPDGIYVIKISSQSQALYNKLIKK